MCSKRSAAMTCAFGVQQNTIIIGSMRHCATHRAACSAAYVFNVRFRCTISMCIQTAHPKRTVCCNYSVIGNIFCCTPKTHVIAADRLLHIQTAHPKRKCNRPLTNFVVMRARCMMWQRGKQSFSSRGNYVVPIACCGGGDDTGTPFSWL
jgi:hypothetical protein